MPETFTDEQLESEALDFVARAYDHGEDYFIEFGYDDASERFSEDDAESLFEIRRALISLATPAVAARLRQLEAFHAAVEDAYRENGEYDDCYLIWLAASAAREAVTTEPVEVYDVAAIRSEMLWRGVDYA